MDQGKKVWAPDLIHGFILGEIVDFGTDVIMIQPLTGGAVRASTMFLAVVLLSIMLHVALMAGVAQPRVHPYWQYPSLFQVFHPSSTIDFRPPLSFTFVCLISRLPLMGIV
jgi:hypothetical protein